MNVTKYTADLENALSNSKRTLVIATATWCGHCKTLAPEIVKIEHYLSKRTVDVDFCHIDESKVNPQLLRTFGVDGYPTIFLVSYGQLVSTYNGPRASSSIINYAVSSSIF